jgi:carboxymethylenebutenolidase
MTVGIRQLMGEIERVRDSFQAAVFLAGDLDAALAFAAADCVLVNEPMRTGASGGAGLRRYLGEDLLPHLPAGLTFQRISRTTDRWRVVDEAAVGFTHDRELPWLLPGAAPSHRSAQVLMISVVTVRESRITAHRTLWDFAGLLTQLHLHPSDVARPATV